MADDRKHAEVDAHGAYRGGEAGKHSRGDDRRRDNGDTHHTEGTADGYRVDRSPVEFKFGVVDEVDGVCHNTLATNNRKKKSSYDQLMLPVIENIPMLVVVMVLTIPVAILAMRLAERAMKRPLVNLRIFFI